MGTVTIKKKGSKTYTLRALKPGDAFQYEESVCILMEETDKDFLPVFNLSELKQRHYDARTQVKSVNVTITVEPA